MKSVRLLVAVCVSSILLFANAYSQTTDTKQPATAVKPKVQKPIPKKTKNLNQTRTNKNQKSKAAARRKNDVPDIPLTNARITFDHAEFDFGSVPPGAKVTHHFPVSNTGPDTLVISKIKAG
ncbi:MAG: DUF1573 domain-containing protein [candidate division Zixibacteria bacterium]|nr:DUF1573 domain-containing protein [candidate division Zixibacteria bacterium]